MDYHGREVDNSTFSAPSLYEALDVHGKPPA